MATRPPPVAGPMGDRQSSTDSEMTTGTTATTSSSNGEEIEARERTFGTIELGNLPPPRSDITGHHRKQPARRIGPYDIVHTVGKGNFAVVKLAVHRTLRTKVAIKMMDKELIGTPNIGKVTREIEAMKRLDHPFIIKLYQVIETETKIFLVMEYASRGEVFDHVSLSHAFTEKDARELFWQLVCGMHYCHAAGVVHRDLKAENLLLDSNFQIKVADFGFCNFFRPKVLLSTHCGSPQYAAPELFKGELYDGPKADVWSMGVILYILVCGSFPFPGESLGSIRAQVLRGLVRFPFYLSSACEQVIRGMLQVDPKRRSVLEQVMSSSWMLTSPNVDHYHAMMDHYAPSAAVLRQATDPSAPADPCIARVDAAGVSKPDEDILAALSSVGYNRNEVIRAVTKRTFDRNYAAYHLLRDKAKRAASLRLRKPAGAAAAAEEVSRAAAASSVLPSTALHTVRIPHHPLPATAIPGAQALQLQQQLQEQQQQLCEELQQQEQQRQQQEQQRQQQQQQQQQQQHQHQHQHQHQRQQQPPHPQHPPHPPHPQQQHHESMETESSAIQQQQQQQQPPVPPPGPTLCPTQQRRRQFTFARQCGSEPTPQPCSTLDLLHMEEGDEDEEDPITCEALSRYMALRRHTLQIADSSGAVAGSSAISWLQYLPQLNLPANLPAVLHQPVARFMVKDPHLLAPPDFMTPYCSSFPRRSSDGAAEFQPLHRSNPGMGGSVPEAYRRRGSGNSSGGPPSGATSIGTASGWESPSESPKRRKPAVTPPPELFLHQKRYSLPTGVFRYRPQRYSPVRRSSEGGANFGGNLANPNDHHPLDVRELKAELIKLSSMRGATPESPGHAVPDDFSGAVRCASADPALLVNLADSPDGEPHSPLMASPTGSHSSSIASTAAVASAMFHSGRRMSSPAVPTSPTSSTGPGTAAVPSLHRRGLHLDLGAGNPRRTACFDWLPRANAFHFNPFHRGDEDDLGDLEAIERLNEKVLSGQLPHVPLGPPGANPPAPAAAESSGGGGAFVMTASPQISITDTQGHVTKFQAPRPVLHEPAGLGFGPPPVLEPPPPPRRRPVDGDAPS